MNDGFRIITNNPMVKERLGEQYNVEFEDLSYEGTLRKVRDLVHQGYQMLSHPLSGSVKPNETPYKSIMVSCKQRDVDITSVDIIQNAIMACGKFQFKSDKYKPEVYEDFQVIDFTLISSAIPSAESWQ